MDRIARALFTSEMGAHCGFSTVLARHKAVKFAKKYSIRKTRTATLGHSSGASKLICRALARDT